jgi:protein O-mannosyl-transferase
MKKRAESRRSKVPARPESAAAAARASSSEFRSNLLLAATLALLAFCAYLPALRGSLLFDDRALPYGRPDAEALPWRPMLSGVRPLLQLTFWLEIQLWGKDPFGYHVLNLLFHVANSLMVGWIANHLLAWAGEAGSKRRWLAWFAAGLFALHPLQSEAVAYIASLSENMSLFFFFAAFGVFLAGEREGIGFGRALGILALLALAGAVKEHVLVLVVLLLLTDYYWNPGFTLEGIRKNWRLYILFPIGLLTGGVIIWNVLRKADTAGFGLKNLTWYQYFLAQCEALWIYPRLFLLPFGQNVDHAFPMVRSLGDPVALLGLALLIAAAVAAWIYRRRYPLASYGYFAYLVLMAPTSSFLPIRDALVERRMYLAFLGLLLMLLEALRRWRLSGVTLAGALTALLAICTLLTFQRAGTYASPIAMWEDSVAANPANDRAQFQLAYAYYETGRCAEAAARYEKAAQLKAPDYTLLLDWGLSLDCAGKPEDAAAKINEALRLEETAHGWAVLGMVRAKTHQYEAALAALAKAIQLKPRFEMSYVYRGNIYYLQDRYPEAQAEFQKALSLNPANQDARKGLEETRRMIGK